MSKDEWYESDLIWNNFTSATQAWKTPGSITILISTVWDNGLETLSAPMALAKSLEKSLENTVHCLIRGYSARHKEREKKRNNLH